MKKNLLAFILLSLSFKLHALEAVVIVLEAPILKDANYGSKVLATVRKGKKIYLHRTATLSGELPEFIPTIDRAGNPGFVPSKYLKVIYNTSEEYKTSISYAGNDPTDYRIEEPISRTYPFSDSTTLRASASFHLGSNLNTPYFYGKNYDSQANKPEMGARFTFLKNADHDKNDRFYFGGIGYIASTKNTLYFGDESTGQESRDVIRLGPFFNFDAYKDEKYRLSLGTGFTFNYLRTRIERESNFYVESRFFNGYSLSPLINIAFQINKIFPHTDLVTGLDASFYLPYKLSGDNNLEHPELWGDSSTIESRFKAQASGYIGLQFSH